MASSRSLAAVDRARDDVDQSESILVVTRSTPDRLDIEAVSPRYLDAHWRLVWSTPGVTLALTDLEGHTVLGDPRPVPQPQSLRTAAVTNLPWTVQAIETGASPTPLSRQASFMLAALSVMLCVVLAGGHLIVRALTRELRVSRLQSDFVSAVSHEFRTPLTTVRHLSQLLARGRVASDARRAEFYGILVRESDRLQRLVENLLDFARVESGEVAYRFEAIAPGPFIRDVVNDFSGELADPAARVSYRWRSARAAGHPRGSRHAGARVLEPAR